MSRAFLLAAALFALALGGCDSGNTSVKASPAPPTAIGTTSTIPTGVTATPGDAQVTLAWSPIKGAVRYNAYWSTVSGVGSGGIQLPSVTSPATQSGLVNGVTYYYVVTEVGAAGESPPSVQVSATPAPVPAAPTGVNAVAGNSQVTIAWNAVAGAASYNVYWSTTKGAGTGGARIMGAVPPFVHVHLANGTPYYYVVTASNATGEGPASVQVSATPVAPPPGPPPLPPGSLDPAFNGSGVVTFNISSPFVGTSDQGKSVVTDSLNRPVLLGSSIYISSGAQHQSVSRWLASGAPDAAFGTTPNESVEPNTIGGFNPLGGTSNTPAAIAQDGSGRLYVLSNGANALLTQFGLVLWRYLPSGVLDTAFNGSGFVTIFNSIGGTQAGGNALAVDSKGRIVVGGYMFDVSFRQYATVWRFTSSGTPDADFGLNSNGIAVQTAWGPLGSLSALPGLAIGGFSNPTDLVASLVIDSLDRIVISGTTESGASTFGNFIARLSAGTVGVPGSGGIDDLTFGDSLYNYTVVFSTLGGNYDTAFGLAQNSTGTAQYVVGYSNDSTAKSWMTVWGFANGFSATAGGFFDGVLDSSFGSAGHASRTGSAGGTIGDAGNAAVVDGMGRIVVAGRSSRPTGESVTAVWRMFSNGAPDAGFSTPSSVQAGSVWEPNAAGGTSDTANGLALDSQGRLVVAGYSFTPGNLNERSVLWRLIP